MHPETLSLESIEKVAVGIDLISKVEVRHFIPGNNSTKIIHKSKNKNKESIIEIIVNAFFLSYFFQLYS